MKVYFEVKFDFLDYKQQIFISLLVVLQLFYSVAYLSCHNYPIQSNNYNSILTADTVPGDFKDCSVSIVQLRCYIILIWMQNPNQTTVILAPDGDRRDVTDERNLENTIIFKNNGITIQ
jgi:hypothetical protein